MIVALVEVLLTVLAMAAVQEVVAVAVVVGAVPPLKQEVTLPVKQEVVKVKMAVVEVGAVNWLEAAVDGAVKVAHLANAGKDLDHLAQVLMLLLIMVPE
jgi:hypothetical protein